ncbi:MAG: PorT family protein [Bacteroidales bacterium]|nr:PorT family protein [Bacteroidales bacterium]
MQLKRIIIVSIAICLGFGLFAQRRSPIPNFSYQDAKSYNFGFLLGINQMDFRVKTNDYFTSSETLSGIRTWGNVGFTVGALANKKLHEFWDLRSGVIFSFGGRGLIYYMRESPIRVVEIRKGVESTTIDLPLELKWKGMRDYSLRPYVISGFRYSMDMASNAKKTQQNEDDFIVKLKRDDFLFTTGVGFDFYLPYGNRVGIEIKMAFGMVDLLVREHNIFTDGIGRLTSRSLQISINIE